VRVVEYESSALCSSIGSQNVYIVLLRRINIIMQKVKSPQGIYALQFINIYKNCYKGKNFNKVDKGNNK
jgi:hypothetical protein